MLRVESLHCTRQAGASSPSHIPSLLHLVVPLRHLLLDLDSAGKDKACFQVFLFVILHVLCLTASCDTAFHFSGNEAISPLSLTTLSSLILISFLTQVSCNSVNICWMSIAFWFSSYTQMIVFCSTSFLPFCLKRNMVYFVSLIQIFSYF